MSRFSSRTPVILAVGISLLLTAPAAAQTARAALDTWIHHLNEVEGDELLRYIKETFSDEFQAQVSAEQIVGFTGQLRGAGTYSVHSIESETDTELVALLKTTSEAWFRASLNAAGDPPKIHGLLVQPATPPEGEGTPVEWSSLDDLASALAEKHSLPGVAIAWARLGGEPSVGTAGVRSIDADDAIQPADRFHIGSITKSVTSTALGAVVESGKLSWSTTLAEALPDLAKESKFANVTLEKLVRHLARIPPHLTFDEQEMTRLNSFEGDNTQQRRTYAKEILASDPIAEGFSYSNAGYALAGHVAEVASGISWEEHVAKTVFEPLGLESCGIGWPATEASPAQPRGHFGDGDGRRAQGLDQYKLGAFMRPAGDVHCNVADLTRYGLAHLAGLEGEDGFLKAATIEELHRTTEGAPYAAGWGVDPESGQHRHNGSAGTFFSYLTIDPEAKIVVALLTNSGPGGGQVAAQTAAAEILARHAD